MHKPGDDFMKQIIHKSLDDRGGVSEPERHRQVLVVAHVHVKQGFPLFALPDPDQMLGVSKIELREVILYLQIGKGGED